MYPYSSGMPYPPQPPTNEQQSVPFGAGWVAPMQQNVPQHHYNHHSQPPSLSSQSTPTMNYQQLPNQHGAMPFGSSGSYGGPPYPASQSISPPYPTNASHHPHMGPSAGPPYPAQHHQQQGVGFNAGHAAPQYHNPHYGHPASHAPYSANHGYTPVMTSGGYESPAGNMAHCFEELSHRQGHDVHRSSNQYLQAPKEGTPTVFPAQGFDPVKDAHDLRKAMKGFGTDENALINIICRRTNSQRQEIQRQYKTHFGKDLIEDIKSETSGNFEKLLVGLLRPIVDFYCAELNDAMAGLGTKEEVLIEILCTLSNQEIHTIKHQYLRLYGAHLESELKSETSGNFKRLLVSLCTAARDESGQIDPNQAQIDARELLKAGELRVGTDESMFNMILCQRNYQQLKLIFQEYERMTEHSLEKAIKKEFSGDIMEGLIAIYKCVTNKAEYFASRLHKSMAGIGTNDGQLIRVIVTRCEYYHRLGDTESMDIHYDLFTLYTKIEEYEYNIDMADIKVAFERLYGKSLKSWIKGDTSGHYKHALYALVGEERSS